MERVDGVVGEKYLSLEYFLDHPLLEFGRCPGLINHSFSDNTRLEDAEIYLETWILSMGKSRIKDRWLREKQRRDNLEKGYQPNSKTEMPRKRTSGFIQKMVGYIKPYWMAKNIGHKRTTSQYNKISGMVRARLKEETRREIDNVNA